MQGMCQRPESNCIFSFVLFFLLQCVQKSLLFCTWRPLNLVKTAEHEHMVPGHAYNLRAYTSNVNGCPVWFHPGTCILLSTTRGQCVRLLYVELPIFMWHRLSVAIIHYCWLIHFHSHTWQRSMPIGYIWSDFRSVDPKVSLCRPKASSSSFTQFAFLGDFQFHQLAMKPAPVPLQVFSDGAWGHDKKGAPRKVDDHFLVIDHFLPTGWGSTMGDWGPCWPHTGAGAVLYATVRGIIWVCVNKYYRLLHTVSHRRI